MHVNVCMHVYTNEGQTFLDSLEEVKHIFGTPRGGNQNIFTYLTELHGSPHLIINECSLIIERPPPPCISLCHVSVLHHDRGSHIMFEAQR